MFNYLTYIFIILYIKISYGQNTINYQGYILRCPTATNFLAGTGSNIWPATRVPGNPPTYACNANPNNGFFNRCPIAGGNAQQDVLVLIDGTDAPIHVCACCYTDFNTFLQQNLPVVGADPGDDSITMNLCVNAHSDCYNSKDKCVGVALSDYYQRYCPYTCGLCTRTTACVDLKTNCKYYMDYCEVDEYLPIMLYECPKTCGFCAKKVTYDTTAPCLDTTATCQSRTHLCNIPSFVETMKEECMASCGYCESIEPKTIAPPVKPKSSPIILPNSQTFITICKDERRDCSSLKSLCNEPSHHSWLVQQCSLTCNFCDDDRVDVEEEKPITVLQPVIVKVQQTHLSHSYQPNPSDEYYKNYYNKNLLKIAINRNHGNVKHKLNK
ncbi:ShKT domain-containing protein [Strongyloides ratti]|uniref:ShKT domain-containing protein n=1 Tax=Strongyloides ratti TaxID=34506 RepID=A0A090LCF3_STRRB|nr:ShKT domain-containing protein [Strongyloides ratti]CEF67476.1 ShKT domain-containing protein [Strongyloides ratti]